MNTPEARKNSLIGRERRALTTKIYVGAKGHFFFGLPGEPVKELSGEVTRIVEGASFAVVSVRGDDGVTRLGRL